MLDDRDRYILLVEDDPDDIELTRRAMADIDRAGQLVIARSVHEAREHLQQVSRSGGAPPAVILLDIKMPQQPGLDLLAEVKRQRVEVPVVALTSSLDRRDLAAAYELGVNSYVHKPIDFGEFVELSHALEHYWLRINRQPSTP
jgi:CheY-like chemotaxis protein